MKILRVSYRAMILVSCLIFHIVWVVVPAIFRGRDLDHAFKTSQIWLGWMLGKLGIRVDKQGSPPKGHYIYIGNHRAYMDGILAIADVRALPVVKAEVSNWPLIGYGAKLTGIMFVKRDSKKSRTATLDAIREALKMGFSVLVYPEGTTHLKPTTMDFRTGAFSLAAKEGFGIVPMAIDYKYKSDAWVGDETFVPHFIRCFGRKNTYVKIRYGQPIFSDTVDLLVQTTKQWIDENMLAIRQEFELEKTSEPIPAFAE
ncbi:MAG: 1-acyl-sn-glycerol-3-phosphate acyltransferase [Saprospiraceae bacterium]|nr:1-acyl-sn-glycerol-3-phosphate acyltransferase [Saprospiraceae bacterium]